MKTEFAKRIYDITQGSMQVRLLRAAIGSCTCQTKSPDYVEHATLCRFRLIMEVLMDDAEKLEKIGEEIEIALARKH